MSDRKQAWGITKAGGACLAAALVIGILFAAMAQPTPAWVQLIQGLCVIAGLIMLPVGFWVAYSTSRR